MPARPAAGKARFTGGGRQSAGNGGAGGEGLLPNRDRAEKVPFSPCRTCFPKNTTDREKQRFLVTNALSVVF
ncbi:MAG: hypothetical protein LBR07_01345 [Puniceicoccales bacterium]|nr:hypothetical protein [Puniceicoccales bacterium]